MSHKRSIVRDYQEMKAHIKESLLTPHPHSLKETVDLTEGEKLRKNCSVQIQNKEHALKTLFL